MIHTCNTESHYLHILVCTSFRSAQLRSTSYRRTRWSCIGGWEGGGEEGFRRTGKLAGTKGEGKEREPYLEGSYEEAAILAVLPDVRP